MEKACREAKQRTSWLAPNEQFESAVRHFIEGIYEDCAFKQDFEKFVETLIEPGRINSLSQTLLKFTAPGIPDTYQGEELWDLSLVDPDNRRPVDYALRRRLLGELPALRAKDVLRRIDEGLPKLWTIYHALRVRRERPAALGESGAYRPFYAHGPKEKHLVAYQRGEEVIVMVPRLSWKLAGDWQGTSVGIPEGDWVNALSGEQFAGGSMRLIDVFRAFPVALLVKSR